YLYILGRYVELLRKRRFPFPEASLVYHLSAATTVLVSSIAIVIGPTPPGTGVIQPATSLTLSNSTSPTVLPSRLLIPTSITTAPGLTQSPFTISGCPTAATSISACLHSATRSFVLE